MRKEKFIKICDVMIEVGIISILSLTIFMAKSISLQESLVLFIFLCFFLLGYLQLKTKYIALTFIILMILGIGAITLQIFESLLIKFRRPDRLWTAFIVHLNRPPFKIWLVLIIMLGFYYLYKRLEDGLKETKPIIEGLSIILISIVIYDLTLPLSIIIKRYNYIYYLPYTSLLLSSIIFIWSVKFMADGNIIFFHRQLAYSYLCTSLGILFFIPFLFLIISPFYSLDLTQQKGIVKYILGMLLFTLLLCAQIHKERNRCRFKLFLSIITGIVILISWIYGIRIFEYFPKFDIFGL